MKEKEDSNIVSVDRSLVHMYIQYGHVRDRGLIKVAVDQLNLRHSNSMPVVLLSLLFLSQELVQCLVATNFQ